MAFPLRENSEDNFGNARDLGNCSREHGNTDLLGVSNKPNLISDPTYQVESDPPTFRVPFGLQLSNAFYKW